MRDDQLRKFNDFVKGEMVRLTCKIIANEKNNNKNLSKKKLREIEARRDLLWEIENSIDKYLLKFNNE